MYLYQQHTHAEMIEEVVHWVTESLQPYEIISDLAFICLMKTGCPEYYLPLPAMVSHDVCLIFAHTQNHIAKMLQEYHSQLNFTIDGWTSPNHCTFIAFAVYLELLGIVLSIPLDIVKVPRSHTGKELAKTFVHVLEEFKISDKACSYQM